MQITLKNGRTLPVETLVEFGKVAEALVAARPYLLRHGADDANALLRKYESGMWTADDVRTARTLTASGERARAAFEARPREVTP